MHVRRDRTFPSGHLYPSEIAVNASVNSRLIRRVVAKPLVRCVRQQNEKRNVFRSRRTLSAERVTDLADSLVTSYRPPGWTQKGRDDRTWNAGVAVRTADVSRRTADAAIDPSVVNAS